MRPEEEIADAAMAIHGPLRNPGGAGRVDDVREPVRGHLCVDPRVGLASEARVIVEIDGCDSPHADRVGRRAMGEYDSDLGVFEHEDEPFARVGGIERHVRAARLEDGEQRNHEIERALHADSHPRLRPHTERAKPVGEMVRPPIELAVRERMSLVLDGDGLGRAIHLRFHQPVQRQRRRVFLLRGVPRREVALIGSRRLVADVRWK